MANNTTNNNKLGGKNSRTDAKKQSRDGQGNSFPIPLQFLYRDPRPAGVKGKPAANLQQVANQNSSQWDGDEAANLTLTVEQIREKKTLYSANIAHGQCFAKCGRNCEAVVAFTKVRNPQFFQLHLSAHVFICID